MVKGTADRKASQDARLRQKTQEHQLQRLAIQGAGLTPWEADVLVRTVQEVFFGEPTDRPLPSGKMRYSCVAATEGAGKPLDECQMTTVVLTLLAEEDLEAAGPCRLRQRKVLRLAAEAREQGGLLSQEDLARLLSCDVRTIRRDVRELREGRGISVATRGQQKDMGPGVTHRDLAVRLWLEGKEPLEVARHIDHSLRAVERYIGHFCRVIFLLWKRLNTFQIALAVGISVVSVQRYIDLYHKVHRTARYRHRLEEVEIVAGPYYEAEDQKKGPSPSVSSNGERRRT